MRIVCISDTHQEHQRLRIPDGDLLVHAGDFCSLGTEREIHKFAKWLRSLPHRSKVIVAGNHDRFFEQQPGLARLYLEEPGVTYLQDSGLQIEGVRFWGSPWQPWFMDWAFNLPRKGEALRQRWNLIPVDTDVLVTHCPPHGVLDQVRPRRTSFGVEEEGSGPLGCEELRIRLPAVKPALHVFGHIHDGYGVMRHGKTTFANACICTEDYEPTNIPLVFDLDVNTMSPKWRKKP